MMMETIYATCPTLSEREMTNVLREQGLAGFMLTDLPACFYGEDDHRDKDFLRGFKRVPMLKFECGFLRLHTGCDRMSGKQNHFIAVEIHDYREAALPGELVELAAVTFSRQMASRACLLSSNWQELIFAGASEVSMGIVEVNKWNAHPNAKTLVEFLAGYCGQGLLKADLDRAFADASLAWAKTVI